MVSHWSAAALYQILPAREGGLIHIAISRGRRRPKGVRVHRLTTLHEDERTTRAGIPVTSPARTVLDLAAAGMRWRPLERALAEGLDRRTVSTERIRTTLERHRGHPGSARLRIALGHGQPTLTRSEAEERFRALLQKADAPTPEFNVRIGDREVDVYWPREGLAIEVDGFQFHGNRRAFETDRRRDAELVARGVRVMRVTWNQIEREPEALLFTLGGALGG